VTGLSMASLGFFLLIKLNDIYPYNLIAATCLVEAAIYFRCMRMILCPS
jgi:hypothetical protein